MNKQNYTNFDSNLAMMVIYLLSSLNSIGQSVYELDSRQTDKNGQNYTNFESNVAMMVIYLPVKFEFDWTKPFRVRVQKREC